MKKLVLISFLLFLNSCFLYEDVYGTNIVKDGYIYIEQTDEYSDVIEKLSPFLDDVGGFKWVAEQKKYPELIKAGKYKIKKGENNSALINRLRIGDQEQITLRIGQGFTLPELSVAVAKKLQATDKEITDAILNHQVVKQNNFDLEKAKIFFLADTYHFYWTTTGEEFFDRMKGEYDKFWTDSNRKKAKKLGLTPLEVSSLAAIVQSETAKKDEAPKVAGLYLNRLRKGIKLQADPTVIYAKKLKEGMDTKIERVYYKDLRIPSPYNTYYTKGLPPAPIALPTRNALEAVLNADKHDYIYMCASVDRVGYHEFTSSISEHEKNAQKFRAWLDQRGVK